MKKTHVLLLCLTLVLALSVTMLLASCNGSTEKETDAAESASDTVTDTDAQGATEPPATEAPTEKPTEAPTDAPEVPTAPEEETKGNEGDGDETETGEVVYNPEDFPEDQYIVIQTADDLMALGTLVEDKGLFEMTVVFLADIDLEGYEWVPLNGYNMTYVTFDGLGHTIKNMTINYNTERELTGSNDPGLGCGFVGTVGAGCDLEFRNLTFEDAYITARERHVGCLVGRSLGGTCTFENITVRNFTVDGWCDNNNTSEETDGYPICFRVAGIMGASWGGYHSFTNVTVENLDISGFHNLAGILGYDASGAVSAFSFENCKVENAKMTFSYFLSDTYAHSGAYDRKYKLVSVFYNGAQWVDNIDECVEMGNTYSNVSFFDWTRDNYEYTPDDFRSWTQEEGEELGFSLSY